MPSENFLVNLPNMLIWKRIDNLYSSGGKKKTILKRINSFLTPPIEAPATEATYCTESSRSDGQPRSGKALDAYRYSVLAERPKNN